MGSVIIPILYKRWILFKRRNKEVDRKSNFVNKSIIKSVRNETREMKACVSGLRLAGRPGGGFHFPTVLKHAYWLSPYESHFVLIPDLRARL